VQAAPIVGRVDELRPGQMKLVRINDLRVVLARTDDGWTAFEDRCPHMGGSLADGVLAGDCVQCPWHGSQFDVRSGELLAGPAGTAIRTWRVQQDGDQVRLVLAARGTYPTHGIAAPAPPLPM
jgi:nitrite reductase/ring-hydroxylating ferredoxin subunit